MPAVLRVSWTEIVWSREEREKTANAYGPERKSTLGGAIGDRAETSLRGANIIKR